jgi:hypothetical protein
MFDGASGDRPDLAPQGVELRNALADLRLGGLLPADPPSHRAIESDRYLLRSSIWEGFDRVGIDAILRTPFREHGYHFAGRIDISRRDGEIYQWLGTYGTLRLECVDRIDQDASGSLSDSRRYVDAALWTEPGAFLMDSSQALSLVEQIESVAAASYAPFLKVATRDFWVARRMVERGASLEVSLVPTFDVTRTGKDMFGLAPSTESDADTAGRIGRAVEMGDFDRYSLLAMNLEATPGRVTSVDTGGIIRMRLTRAFSYDDV